jgi:hypothetical protein
MGMGQRRIVMLVLAAMLLGGLVWAPVAAAADTPAYVLGTVYGTGYQYNNLPLSGADVELWQFSGVSPSWTFTDTGWGAITFTDGGFALNLMMQNADVSAPLYYTGANCFLVTKATNYAFSTDLATYIPNAFTVESPNIQWRSVTLTVLPTKFKGVVRRGNRNLKGVKVAVAGKSVKTNSKGQWSISGMLLKPGAKYTVTYTKSGYRKVTKSYTSLPNATRDVGVVKMVRR